MRFLPIVERELRVAARQSRTWWGRVLTLAIALVGFVFVYLQVSRWNSGSTLGHALFTVLGGFGMAYGLLAGPLATADCLSRERREGTLGLLFLTDLRSYDVILGKMGAASLSFVLSLLAALPIVAIPVLLGGVSAVQFTQIILAILNIMFLSLAVGVCASSLSTSGRSALALTFLFLAFLTLGLPWLGEEVLGIRFRGRMGPWFYSVCPLYTMDLTLDNGMRAATWKYWVNMGGMHLLAWLCLVVACLRARTSWRDLPASRLTLRCSRLLEPWTRGSSRSRLIWRLTSLDRNPVTWLDGRDRLQQRLLWCLCLASAGLFGFIHQTCPNSWPDADWAISWSALSHYVFCLWLATQAPRRFADDKQSGALELLLCTPLPVREIVRGGISSLRARFGRAFLVLLALDAFLVYWYLRHRGFGWPRVCQHQMFTLSLYGLAVFPLQAWTFARVGLYQGLVRANSLRATFTLVWRIGLLPWLLFFVFALAYDLGRRHFGGLPRFSRLDIVGVWVAIHMLVCACFLAHASWQLHRHFRSLATQAALPPWWKRCWRLLQRGFTQ